MLAAMGPGLKVRSRRAPRGGAEGGAGGEAADGSPAAGAAARQQQAGPRLAD